MNYEVRDKKAEILIRFAYFHENYQSKFEYICYVIYYYALEFS